MKQTLTILAFLTSVVGYGQQDSTIMPMNGIAGITPKSDSTADTFRLNSFVEIGDVPVMGMTSQANLLTVSMEEGDFETYVAVRYNLLDYRGNVLYTSRYRIAGSCYDYFREAGVAYVFWKVCNAKGFVLAE
jgi:hypothetical protein